MTGVEADELLPDGAVRQLYEKPGYYRSDYERFSIFFMLFIYLFIY